LNEVIEILQNYSLQFEDTLELYPDYPILYAFEEHYNFNSLRRQIEDKVTALENRDALMLDNDPDDHYIVSNYIRTVLTPDCEVVINGLICIICSDFTVVVSHENYNKEREIVNAIRGNSSEQQLVILSGNEMIDANIHIFAGNEDFPSCFANFTFTPDATNPLKYNFVNWSYGQSINNCTFFWQANQQGIIQSATTRDATFTFTAGGTANVTLITLYNGSECSRIEQTINVGSCTADFMYVNLSLGKIKFIETSASSSTITNYKWDFGDGNSSNWLGATGYQIEHIYQVNTTYSVKLTIKTSDGCESSITKNVTVTTASECCRINDIIKKNYSYNQNNNKLHFIFHYSGIWPFRWITAKTINYKKKSNGSWKKEKATRIGASFAGDVYNSNCQFVESYNVSPNNLQLYEEQNKKETTFSKRPSDFTQNFRIAKKSIKSWFSICNAGTNEADYTGLQLHNEGNRCD
jgi:PKD repeat protein